MRRKLAVIMCTVTVMCYCIVISSHSLLTVFVGDPRPLYVITPTYRRPTQRADLTRLAQTLMHVRGLTWIVVEDSNSTTPAVAQLLDRTGLRYVHLNAPMPEEYKNCNDLPRGVSNRMKGLEWVRADAVDGVLYFADDDNTYDIRIFEEIRDTKRVSMWPVGFLSKGVGTPVVRNGTVIGFFGWSGGRRYAVDMAGFAVSVEFLLQRQNASMPFSAGHEEDGFLMSLQPLPFEDIEPKASNCTEVLVWHTRTAAPPPQVTPDLNNYSDTNIIQLLQQLIL